VQAQGYPPSANEGDCAAAPLFTRSTPQKVNVIQPLAEQAWKISHLKSTIYIYYTWYIAYTYSTWYREFGMNKTVYIRDEDVHVWDRARELAGDKLAPVIVAGLKRFITEKEAEQVQSKGFERIVVSFNDSTAHGIPKVKAFHGKWVFSPEKPLTACSEEGDRSFSCAVAISAKGAAVFYWWEEDEHGRAYQFKIFPSLESAAADSDVNWAACRVIRELGVPVEELDI
jgi:predicted TIM-barrel fold metal-dependent hydrolase